MGLFEKLCAFCASSGAPTYAVPVLLILQLIIRSSIRLTKDSEKNQNQFPENCEEHLLSESFVCEPRVAVQSARELHVHLALNVALQIHREMTSTTDTFDPKGQTKRNGVFT